MRNALLLWGINLLLPICCFAQKAEMPLQPTAEAYAVKAANFVQQKRYPEAIDALNRVIDLKPDYKNARYNLASAYMLDGDIDQALTGCNKLLELEPHNVDALLLRARAKDRSGDEAGAIEDCGRVIAIDPNNAEAYNIRALARFDAHEYRAIIADCDRAIKLKPAYYDAYIQRGDAYDDLGEYDKAIADYKKAESIDPTQLLAYRECAGSFAKKNNIKSALEYVNKGLQIEPENKYLLGHKYRLLRQSGDIKGAVLALDQSIKYHPDSAALFNWEKVQLYDSLRDDASACKFAFEAIKGGLADGYDYLIAHPCTAYKKQPLFLAQPFILQADKEYSTGKYDAEIATLTKIIALLPDSASLYYNRGAAKRKLNNFAGAIEDYNKAIGLRPKFPAAIMARSVARMYLNDVEGSKKDCLLSIAVDPTYAIAYNNYANMIAATDVTGALDFLTKAVYYDKRYTAAYLTRGKLYQQLGKKAEACADFGKAAALGSDEARIERMVNCK